MTDEFRLLAAVTCPRCGTDIQPLEELSGWCNKCEDFTLGYCMFFDKNNNPIRHLRWLELRGQTDYWELAVTELRPNLMLVARWLGQRDPDLFEDIFGLAIVKPGTATAEVVQHPTEAGIRAAHDLIVRWYSKPRGRQIHPSRRLLRAVFPQPYILKDDLRDMLLPAAEREELAIQEKRAIRCPTCKWISHHPEDVRQRYCGNCHAYHAEMHP